MAEAGADPGNRERALAALGLAVRAGRAAVGTRAVLEAAAADEVRLLVVAEDATPNALGRLRGALEKAPSVRCGRKDQLGRALGRGPTVAVAVSDWGLAAKVRALAAREEEKAVRDRQAT